MHVTEGEPAAEDSLRFETRAAVDAVAAHVRSVAATARTEAELSAAAITAVAAAAVMSLLLVVSAWLCLIAAGVWLAVENGLSAGAALLIAGGFNIVVVLVLLLWSKSLLRNVGFARTRQLVFRETR
jgi:hypothetical protein